MQTNKGNTITILVIIVGLIIVGAWVKFGKAPLDSAPSATATSTPSTATINGKTISLIVADTPESREVGLGGRASLGENEAMIFVFEVPDIYEFWMKDMLIPIDIIWLDSAYKIVHIEKNVTPETYPDEIFTPAAESLYVLETNAGFSDQNNLKVGDAVQISLKD